MGGLVPGFEGCKGRRGGRGQTSNLAFVQRGISTIMLRILGWWLWKSGISWKGEMCHTNPIPE